MKEEIKQIRKIVREKQIKFERKAKEAKDQHNIAKQSAQLEDDGSKHIVRRGSYTLSSPIFTPENLPKISSMESTDSSDKDTIVTGPMSLQSDVSEFTEKSSKDMQNEMDKRSTTSSVCDSIESSKMNAQLKSLIENQKMEYLAVMESLKNKFTTEQHELLMNLQSNLLVTSTPLNSSMMTCGTDDAEFTEFKTCLQSQSQSIEEKTIVNEADVKVKNAL